MCCGSTAKEHQFCLEKSGGLTELMRPQCPKFVCKEVSIILSIVVKWSGTESEKSLKFEKKNDLGPELFIDWLSSEPKV